VKRLARSIRAAWLYLFADARHELRDMFPETADAPREDD
jgi:hypothetical protein